MKQGWEMDHYVAIWLWGRRGELRVDRVMEITPVMIGSQSGAWWAIEVQGFLLYGSITLNTQRATLESWGQRVKH